MASTKDPSAAATSLAAVVAFASSASRDRANAAGPAAQRDLVRNTWRFLAQAASALGIERPAEDLDYQRVMSRAYGSLSDWQTTLAASRAVLQIGSSVVYGDGDIVRICAQIYDALHAGYNRRDPNNTITLVRAALQPTRPEAVFRCLDVTDGSDCDLTGPFTSFADFSSQLERPNYGWPPGDWRWFRWRDVPFTTTVFAPPLINSLDLAAQLALAWQRRFVPNLPASPKSIVAIATSQVHGGSAGTSAPVTVGSPATPTTPQTPSPASNLAASLLPRVGAVASAPTPSGQGSPATPPAPSTAPTNGPPGSPATSPPSAPPSSATPAGPVTPSPSPPPSPSQATQPGGTGNQAGIAPAIPVPPVVTTPTTVSIQKPPPAVVGSIPPRNLAVSSSKPGGLAKFVAENPVPITIGAIGLAVYIGLKIRASRRS
jgi:hypothetical protein